MQEAKSDPYDMWLDRTLDELEAKLVQLRSWNRAEYAKSAPYFIGEVVTELTELALRAEALKVPPQ